MGKLLWQATARYGGGATEGKGLRDEIMEGGQRGLEKLTIQFCTELQLSEQENCDRGESEKK